MRSPLPVVNGVGATRLRVPLSGPWSTVAEYVTERFSHLASALLIERFERGEIVAIDGRPLSLATPIGQEEFVWYYRDTLVERDVPFDLEVLYQDENIVVVDKPHFLPTTPGGKFLQNSALVRLRNLLDLPEVAPIHRLDRATAGLLMFTLRPEVRGAYQMLFERRQVQKVYEAVSARPQGFAESKIGELSFPMVYRNYIDKVPRQICVRIDPDREPNSETLIELLGYNDQVVHTLLHPHTGKMHQLRVHLTGLGLPILHDTFYPELQPDSPDDYARPMQLLARELRFADPLSGKERVFHTRRTLALAPNQPRV